MQVVHVKRDNGPVEGEDIAAGQQQAAGTGRGSKLVWASCNWYMRQQAAVAGYSSVHSSMLIGVLCKWYM
jgi:hypothetical protein